MSARCLLDLVRGADGERAEAGALLVADALLTIRAYGSQLKWRGGRGD